MRVQKGVHEKKIDEEKNKILLSCSEAVVRSIRRQFLVFSLQSLQTLSYKIKHYTILIVSINQISRLP